MTKIFISYAHVDQPRVRELVDILRAGGHDPWFDHRLVVGQPWQDQLLAAISTCDCFLYAMTPEAIASTWCQWEFAQAQPGFDSQGCKSQQHCRQGRLYKQCHQVVVGKPRIVESSEQV